MKVNKSNLLETNSYSCNLWCKYCNSKLYIPEKDITIFWRYWKIIPSSACYGVRCPVCSEVNTFGIPGVIEKRVAVNNNPRSITVKCNRCDKNIHIEEENLIPPSTCRYYYKSMCPVCNKRFSFDYDLLPAEIKDRLVEPVVCCTII